MIPGPVFPQRKRDKRNPEHEAPAKNDLSGVLTDITWYLHSAVRGRGFSIQQTEGARYFIVWRGTTGRTPRPYRALSFVTTDRFGSTADRRGRIGAGGLEHQPSND